MKKYISCLLCLCVLFALPFPASAAENRVIDDAGLLIDSEIRSLNDQIHEIKDTYQLDIVLVTTLDLGGLTAREYADNFYDERGYGYGEDASGVLLLVDMGSRQWYISTCGEAIYALTDYSLDVLGDELAYFLSNGYYYDGFENFVNSLPKYMLAYRQGETYDGYAAPDEYEDEIVYYPDSNSGNPPLIAVGIGLVVAIVTILIMRSSMNTAKPQKDAVNYQKEGSYHLHTHRDMFLYSRTSRTRKQQSSSGSGSSVHRSSGGRSHGGRGGRF